MGPHRVRQRRRRATINLGAQCGLKSNAVSSSFRPNTTQIRKSSLVGSFELRHLQDYNYSTIHAQCVKGIAFDAFCPYIQCRVVPSAPLNGLCNPVPKLVLRLTQTLLDILAFIGRPLFCLFESRLPSFLCFVRTTFEVIGRITSLRPSPAQPSLSRALRCIYFLL